MELFYWLNRVVGVSVFLAIASLLAWVAYELVR